MHNEDILRAVQDPKFLARFWGTVDKSGSCWVWTGRTSHRGYGVMHLPKPTWKAKHASRISWTIANGLIPDGMLVCHHCDNPPCVNPSHLFVGTNADNKHDCCAKGRSVVPHAVGQAHPRSKLTRAEVLEIRSLAGRASGAELAPRFGVNRATINRILSGRLWGEVR